jgi:hypothetical protein
MTSEQKAVLDLIRAKIEIAEAQDNRAKTAEMHMQFLINAQALQSLDFSEVISYIDINDSYKTELSKMVNLHKQLKLKSINLVKTL